MSVGANDFHTTFAELYDRYLVPMSFLPHARRLADRVAALAPRSVLETAAGTGAVTGELARILPAEVGITATDLNQPMIALAEANLGSDRIRWKQADALDLPFADAEFDVALCQFGVMFFPDKRQAFGEARRVLRPGGRFLFNAWDSFEANADNPIRIAAGVVGTALGRDPLSFGPAYSYHDEATIRADLAASGFAEIQVEFVSEPSRAPSAPEAAVIVCQGSLLRNVVVAHDASRLDEITNRVAEAFTAHFGTGAVEGSSRALLVSAVRA